MDVSIVTVSFNTRDLLQRTLESVRKSIKRLQYEVIIVDNNSGDGSVEMVREQFPEVILLTNSNNIGISRANNQGAARARGKYILFLNPDTVVNDNAVDELVEFLEHDKEAGAVGCKLLNEDGSLQRSCGRFPKLSIELATRTMLNRLFPKNAWLNQHKLVGWDYSTVREVEWATTACLLVRKEIFDALSGFDENIFIFYDDLEFCLRIHKAGSKVLFYPNVSVYHYHGGSWRSRREVPIKQNIVNVIYYYKKHHTRFALGVLHILLLFEIAIRFLLVIFWQAFREPNVTTKSRLKGLWGGLTFLLFRI